MSARGEAHHSAKLNADKVRHIRASELGMYRLARIHGVSASAIRLARERLTWKHVA